MEGLEMATKGADAGLSENAGCAWLFGLLVVGFVAVTWITSMSGQAARESEDMRYRTCVEAGGQWDGFWDSCTKP
jgi:hypothetical protein